MHFSTFFHTKASKTYKIGQGQPRVIIYIILRTVFQDVMGWSGDAMVLGKLPVPGRPTIWMIEG